MRNDVLYEGNWVNGQIDGKGTYYIGKNIIHGYFKQGVLQGQSYKKQQLESNKNLIYKGTLDKERLTMQGFGELIWTNEHSNQ